MKLILCDRNSRLCDEWALRFKDCEDVIVKHDTFENVEDYDCLVSPANSFGLMDGGIDLAITNYFGNQLQKRVQQRISAYYYGEQPVGTCMIVETDNEKHPYLAHTPTMRVPSNIRNTDNVYNAMRAMLRAVAGNHNIKTVLCPGLGTGIGDVSPVMAAYQMWLAYARFKHPLPINWDNAGRIQEAVWGY